MAYQAQYWDGFIQDVKYGARTLLARPGFSAVAVLSIALGVGATTAIFSVVYAVLVDPYPYRAADRIGRVNLIGNNGRRQPVSYTTAQYLELKSRNGAMEDEIALQRERVVMTGAGLPEAVIQEECSPNVFDFFGVPPLFGRTFSASGAGGHAEPVAVLSYSFWQRAFQGRREILGQKIRLDKNFYTVIGVLPIRFTWNDVDAYTPMDMRPRTDNFLDVFFRVRRGVTQEQIAHEFIPLLQHFRTQVPRWIYPEGPFRTQFINVNEGILGKFANTLLALFASVALLLLIACANVANLLLARAAARESEMAVRMSIGATRFRLVRQLLTESVLLALAGGILGVLLAYRGVQAVVALMPEYSIPHEAVIALNWPVLWFALATSVLTGVIFGLAPALHLSDERQSEGLRSTAKGMSAGTARRRLHDTLMAAEISLSLVLLTGAGLAVQGLLSLERKQLGYDPNGVLTFQIPLGEGRYTTWAGRQALYQEVVARLRRLPAIEAAAITSFGAPPWNGGGPSRLILDGRKDSQAAQVRWNMVSDGYFATVHTPLLRGRDLQLSDIMKGNRVAVVTEDLVKRYFPGGQDPIGHHFAIDLFDEPIPPAFLKAPQFQNSFEIVGVAGTARNSGLSTNPQPAVFMPYSVLSPPSLSVFLRTRSDPTSIVNQAREVVRSADTSQPITLVRTLEE